MEEGKKREAIKGKRGEGKGRKGGKGKEKKEGDGKKRGGRGKQSMAQRPQCDILATPLIIAKLNNMHQVRGGDLP